MYYRFFAQLCRAAYKRIPNEDIAEELVQDVFVNLWKKRAKLDSGGNVAAYLHAVLRNLVLHELRSQLIISRHTQKLLTTAPAYADDLNELIDCREVEQKFKKVVESLPPQCREAFTLSRYENLSYKAIAARMNISVNTVEKHVGKALLILRREFRVHNLPLALLIAAAFKS